MSPRRTPTKAELLRLQKLYRTDRKMAEALGNGVTEHLVAYWRRKKGIATYSFPKFSEKEIQEVWDRFGDDFHAGMELGISKPAFYNWRRRYKITKKPTALKLEQLSLELFTADKTGPRRSGSGRKTIAQKILAEKSGQAEILPGMTVDVEPDLTLVTNDAGQVLAAFEDSGPHMVWNPARVVIALGNQPSPECQDPCRQREIHDFARRQHIKNFFDIGEGDGCQTIMERGMALPGQLTLCDARDSFACGSIGSLTALLSSSDMATLWRTGRISLTAPGSLRVFISGRAARGVFIADIAGHISSHLTGKVDGKVIEFYGPAVNTMTLSERITLCHNASTTGAAAAICPFDATTRRFVTPRARRPFTAMLADRDANYDGEYSFEINALKPVAVGPDLTVTPLDELTGMLVQRLYIGGTAGGRFDDLKMAADILKGKKINPEVRLIIQPVSRAVYLEALKKGILRVFVEAGADIFNPGYYPFSLPSTRPASGETLFATETGTFAAYVGSAAAVAVAAITGQITNPSSYVRS
jgi:3-isopropylmalate/(R)-2-methylmalate dehydratase large subunit